VGGIVLQDARSGNGNAERLKICHLGKYYPPAAGGIETHVQTLARAQAALGMDVRVVCADHRKHHERPSDASAVCEEIDGGVRVTRCAQRMSFNRLDVCPSLPGVLSRLTDEALDVLHLHTPNPSMLLALALVRPTTPLVITHHSDIIRQRLLKFALRPFERFIYRRAASVQTTSSIYRLGSSFLSRYAEKLEALPLGVDLSPFTYPSQTAIDFAQHLQSSYPAPIWLMVGRLVYYKAVHVAIRALAHVPGTLVIVGAGPLEHELKTLAKTTGVQHRIAWQGYVSRDQLIGAYHSARALWFPSNARSEAFGLVQVEAMASGCPVINTSIAGSGVPWVSRHDESGLTIPVNDPMALADAARSLLENESLHRQLSEGARHRAADDFDHMTMARRSVQIYHRALNAAPQDPEPMRTASGYRTLPREIEPAENTSTAGS
jgi:rhamnosyl/mannosyltransferase